MVSGLFESLLQELSLSMGINGLHPDSNNSCLIALQSGVRIQLEMDKKGEFLVLVSNLGTVPSGKYRENLFRTALKSNHYYSPGQGIFAYSPKTDHLLLFEKLPLYELSGEKIGAVVKPFTEKAARWMEAIQHNDVPVVEEAFTSDRRTSMFGLMR
jgi:hypothetical protein